MRRIDWDSHESILNWTDYIRSNIAEFRKQYEKFSEEEKSLLARQAITSNLILTEPCQVVVLDIKDHRLVILYVLHNKEYPDMNITILENLSLNKFSSASLSEAPILQTLGTGDFSAIFEDVRMVTSSEMFSQGFSSAWQPRKESVFFLFSRNFLTFDAHSFSDYVLRWINIKIESLRRREKINETVNGIKRDAQAIPKIELKTKIVEATGTLKKEIDDLNKKLDEEIGGVRKMIGSTKEFQDFRVFTSDVTDLKKSHVPKDVFEAKIGELTARVDSLSDIRDAYDKVLAQQNEFMKQQASVMSQQSDFTKWVKYATILLPIAVISVPVIEIISVVIRHFLGVQ